MQYAPVKVPPTLPCLVAANPSWVSSSQTIRLVLRQADFQTSETMRKQSGFTLLEMIIVMALMGASLLWYTRYQSRKADEYARQHVANALVNEVKGVINFVRDKHVALTDKNESFVTNPLYLSKDDESSARYQYDAVYHRRISHLSTDDDKITDGDYYIWGEGATQQRYYFISSECKSVKTYASGYPFAKEYLPCKMVTQALNSDFTLDRIAFVNSEDDEGINSIEATIKFALSGEKVVQIANIAPQLAQSFTNVNVSYTHAYVVYRLKNTAAGSSWAVAKNSAGTPIEYSDVANNLQTLQNLGKLNYLGIRFVFDLNDNDNSSVLPDGSVSVDKLCWNPTHGSAEVCYQQQPGTGSHGEDQVMSLTVTDPKLNNNQPMTGTLLTNVVMENTARPVFIFERDYLEDDVQPVGNIIFDEEGMPRRYMARDPSGKTYVAESVGNEKMQDAWYDGFELTTPPFTDQVATSNTNSDTLTSSASINEKGILVYRVHSCPRVSQQMTLKDEYGDIMMNAEGDKPQTVTIDRQLYPRVSVALSSVAADQKSTSSGTRSNFIAFDALSKTRTQLNDASSVVENLAGVAVQANFQRSTSTSNHYQKYVWLISSMVASYNNVSGTGKNIINPTSASYVITRWCSTIPQADMTQEYVNDLAKEPGVRGYQYQQ